MRTAIPLSALKPRYPAVDVMKTLYLIALSFVLGFLLGFAIFFRPAITGLAIESKEYSYTTAICNQENKCIDVLIKCESGNVISLTPVSNLVDLGPDFEDFREKGNNFCV